MFEGFIPIVEPKRSYTFVDNLKFEIVHEDESFEAVATELERLFGPDAPNRPRELPHKYPFLDSNGVMFQVRRLSRLPNSDSLRVCYGHYFEWAHDTAPLIGTCLATWSPSFHGFRYLKAEELNQIGQAKKDEFTPELSRLLVQGAKRMVKSAITKRAQHNGKL